MNEKHLHIRMTITLNTDDWGYNDPRVQKEVNVSLPVDMFSAQLLTKKVEGLVKDAEKELDIKVAELTKEPVEA